MQEQGGGAEDGRARSALSPFSLAVSAGATARNPRTMNANNAATPIAWAPAGLGDGQKPGPGDEAGAG